MWHLSEPELIDIAEGTKPESSMPHLLTCDKCRQQLSDLRTVLMEAAGVDVPEPSPLFWDHLSARVRAAIADEAPVPTRLQTWKWRYPAAAVAASIAVIVVVTFVGGRDPASVPESGSVTVADVPAGSDFTVSLANDPSLDLIAEMAADIDLEAAAEAGLADGSGIVDRAVLTLTPEERIELQRLLNEEMSKS